ncbi:hypothetical protein C8R46DRAFT_1328586, partial [Mycena filopes]
SETPRFALAVGLDGAGVVRKFFAVSAIGVCVVVAGIAGDVQFFIVVFLVGVAVFALLVPALGAACAFCIVFVCRARRAPVFATIAGRVYYDAEGRLAGTTFEPQDCYSAPRRWRHIQGDEGRRIDRTRDGGMARWTTELDLVCG